MNARKVFMIIAAAVLAAGMITAGIVIEKKLFYGDGRYSDETHKYEDKKEKKDDSAGSADDIENEDMMSFDINGDGVINSADMSALIRCMSGQESSGEIMTRSDLNSDGKTDSLDFNELREIFWR